MKKLLIIFGFFLCAFSAEAQDYHFNGVQSKYTYYMQISTAERDAMVLGLNDRVIVNNTTNGKLELWDGDSWETFEPGAIGATQIFEKELTNGENNIDVGFNLTSTTVVYFNGALIPNSLWSGEGTQILNLSLSTLLHDNLTVKN